jgi:hypothetical protein
MTRRARTRWRKRINRALRAYSHNLEPDSLPSGRAYLRSVIEEPSERGVVARTWTLNWSRVGDRA